MALRVTPTLVICAIGAAVTGGLLALPPRTTPRRHHPSPRPHPRATVGAGAGGHPDRRLSFSGPRTAPAGAVVQVTNADAAAHTLTATSGAFDTGVVDQGATASFTVPAEPGTYEFICEIHPSMTGSLVVD